MYCEFLTGETATRWSIEHLSSAGCSDIIVAIGWKKDLMKETLATLECPSRIQVIDVPKYESGPLQTFVTAVELVHGTTNILNPVDLLISPNDMNAIISTHQTDPPVVATLAIDYSTNRGSEVSVSSDEHILSIRGEDSTEFRKASSAILLAFSSDFIMHCKTALEHGESNVFSVLNSIIQQGVTIRAHSVSEAWYDIDTINDVLNANRYFLKSTYIQEAKSIFIPSGDTMEIRDILSLGSGITLNHGVFLKGPCLIQKNSSIGENCIVGPNVSLASDTQIGSHSEIHDSVVFGSSKISAQSKIRDAIIYRSKLYYMEE